MDNIINLKPKWDLPYISNEYNKLLEQMRINIHNSKACTWFENSIRSLSRYDQVKLKSDVDMFKFVGRLSPIFFRIHAMSGYKPHGSSPIFYITQKTNSNEEDSIYPIPEFTIHNGSNSSAPPTFKVTFRQHEYSGGMETARVDAMQLNSINSNFIYKIKRIKNSKSLRDFPTHSIDSIIRAVMVRLAAKSGVCRLSKDDNNQYLINGCYLLENNPDHHKIMQVSINIDSNLYEVSEA